MVSAIKDVFTLLFGADGAVQTFFTWLTSATVLPYFVIGIACSLVLMGIKVVRGAIWGY